jgi:putative ABC transport system substrate-binding protein
VINGPDAVALGWAASDPRPGGNVTGLRAPPGGTVSKSLELLTDILPSARRLASLFNLSLASSGPSQRAVVATAQARGLELLVVDVPTQSDLEPAVERARAWGAEMLYAHYVIPLNSPVERLPDLVRRARLPATATLRWWVERGFLMAYGSGDPAGFRRMRASSAIGYPPPATCCRSCRHVKRLAVSARFWASKTEAIEMQPSRSM